MSLHFHCLFILNQVTQLRGESSLGFHPFSLSLFHRKKEREEQQTRHGTPVANTSLLLLPVTFMKTLTLTWHQKKKRMERESREERTEQRREETCHSPSVSSPLVIHFFLSRVSSLDFSSSSLVVNLSLSLIPFYWWCRWWWRREMKNTQQDWDHCTLDSRGNHDDEENVLVVKLVLALEMTCYCNNEYNCVRLIAWQSIHDDDQLFLSIKPSS